MTLENYMIKATAMLSCAIAQGNTEALNKVREAAVNCLSKVVTRGEAELFISKVILPMAYDMKDDVIKALKK